MAMNVEPRLALVVGFAHQHRQRIRQPRVIPAVPGAQTTDVREGGGVEHLDGHVRREQGDVARQARDVRFNVAAPVGAVKCAREGGGFPDPLQDLVLSRRLLGGGDFVAAENPSEVAAGAEQPSEVLPEGVAALLAVGDHVALKTARAGIAQPAGRDEGEDIARSALADQPLDRIEVRRVCRSEIPYPRRELAGERQIPLIVAKEHPSALFVQALPHGHEGQRVESLRGPVVQIGFDGALAHAAIFVNPRPHPHGVAMDQEGFAFAVHKVSAIGARLKWENPFRRLGAIFFRFSWSCVLRYARPS